MLVHERSKQLDHLLGLTLAELDIPAEVRAAAVAEYEAVANWLRDSWAGVAGRIYPQGSIRLGTMVAPVTRGCEYDIDLVCVLWLTKEVSKKRLKALVGDALRAYVATQPAGSIRLEEGKRCWTLVYPGQNFHMDVLPAIPNDEAARHAIWLTDRELSRWQPSNPIAYAEWFARCQQREMARLLEAEAASRDIDVEDVPPETVKTTLQFSVQALKRHRDLYFEGRADVAPASIVPTTLAGHAYRGGEDIYEVLVDLVQRMPSYIASEAGRWVVANPVLEEENFADRWNTEPKRADVFFEWMESAERDFAGLGSRTDLPHLLEGLKGALGEGPVERASHAYADEVARQQRSGRLRTGPSGLLGGAGVVLPNRPHTFHGASTNTDSPGS